MKHLLPLILMITWIGAYSANVAFGQCGGCSAGLESTSSSGGTVSANGSCGNDAGISDLLKKKREARKKAEEESGSGAKVKDSEGQEDSSEDGDEAKDEDSSQDPEVNASKAEDGEDAAKDSDETGSRQETGDEVANDSEENDSDDGSGPAKPPARKGKAAPVKKAAVGDQPEETATPADDEKAMITQDQAAPSHPARFYTCPKCGFMTDQAGTCSKCGVQLK